MMYEVWYWSADGMHGVCDGRTYRWRWLGLLATRRRVVDGWFGVMHRRVEPVCVDPPEIPPLIAGLLAAVGFVAFIWGFAAIGEMLR